MLPGTAMFASSTAQASTSCGAAGYMFCNLPGLEAMEGQRIRIYYMSLGTEVDLHTPSLAGASQVLPTGWLAPDLAPVRMSFSWALPEYICNVVRDHRPEPAKIHILHPLQSDGLRNL